MNKANAHLYIPLVQAIADGKTLQHQDNRDVWRDLPPYTEVYLGSEPEHYRIKPEPEVVYINKSGKLRYGHPTEEGARKGAAGFEEKYEYVAKKFVEAE